MSSPNTASSTAAAAALQAGTLAPSDGFGGNKAARNAAASDAQATVPALEPEFPWVLKPFPPEVLSGVNLVPPTTK